MYFSRFSPPKTRLRTTWTKLKALNARIEDSFVGDLIGCILLFGQMGAATWLLPLINEVRLSEKL
jgi:hypothetical protein